MELTATRSAKSLSTNFALHPSQTRSGTSNDSKEV